MLDRCENRLILVDMEIHRSLRSLRTPYHLSFGTLSSFESVGLTIRLADGRESFAEVVPLPGYSHETVEDVVAFLELYRARCRESSAGVDLQSLRHDVETELRKSSFCCSPILTAIDLFGWVWSKSAESFDDFQPSFVLPTSTASTEQIVGAYRDAERHGQTLKIKLLGDVAKDLAALQGLENAISSNFSISMRLDANQAYSKEDARSFLSRLKEMQLCSAVELVEQPISRFDWDGAAELSREGFGDILCLDEPIVTTEDVVRAHNIGVSFIKLKLFKQGGIAELSGQARKAFELGLNVILGNGVSTEVGNWVELMLHHCNPELFWGASEANGFLKLQNIEGELARLAKH